MRRIPLPPASASTPAALAVAPPPEPATPPALATTSAVAASRTSIRRLDCLSLHVSSSFPSRCPGRFDDIDTNEVVPARASESSTHATTRGSITPPGHSSVRSPREPSSAPRPSAPRARSPDRPLRGRALRMRSPTSTGSRSATSRSGATSPSRRTDGASHARASRPSCPRRSRRCTAHPCPRAWPC